MLEKERKIHKEKKFYRKGREIAEPRTVAKERKMNKRMKPERKRKSRQLKLKIWKKINGDEHRAIQETQPKETVETKFRNKTTDAYVNSTAVSRTIKFQRINQKVQRDNLQIRRD